MEKERLEEEGGEEKGEGRRRGDERGVEEERGRGCVCEATREEEGWAVMERGGRKGGRRGEERGGEGGRVEGEVRGGVCGRKEERRGEERRGEERRGEERRGEERRGEERRGEERRGEERRGEEREGGREGGEGGREGGRGRGRGVHRYIGGNGSGPTSRRRKKTWTSKTLWFEERQKDDDFTIVMLPGLETCSGWPTRHSAAPELERHLGRMCPMWRSRPGRADSRDGRT